MKPLILITNDDGIFSPGLLAAAEAVSDIGELLIVAPRFQQTTMARSFPRGEDVGKIEEFKLIINGKEILAYGVHGSPAQAVSHAVLEISNRKPDLCISGINYGENLGLCISCSGTIGAALEADSYDIPAIAVSRQASINIQHSSNYIDLDWDVAKKIISKMVMRVIKNGFPKGVSILNINIPDGANIDSEIRITRQSRLNYSTYTKPGKRDFSKGFKLKAKLDDKIHSAEKDSDVYAFYFDKVISITPLSWDLSANAKYIT